MITKITKLPEETTEQIATKKLIEEFNEEAKKQKSKYFIKINYLYPHLTKNIFFGFWEDVSIQIYYNEVSDEFSFIKGICKETFDEVKNILENIPIKFEIELR